MYSMKLIRFYWFDREVSIVAVLSIACIFTRNGSTGVCGVYYFTLFSTSMGVYAFSFIKIYILLYIESWNSNWRRAEPWNSKWCRTERTLNVQFTEFISRNHYSQFNFFLTWLLNIWLWIAFQLSLNELMMVLLLLSNSLRAY